MEPFDRDKEEHLIGEGIDPDLISIAILVVAIGIAGFLIGAGTALAIWAGYGN